MGERIVGRRGDRGRERAVRFEQSDGGCLGKVVDIVTRTGSTAARVGMHVVVAVVFHVFLVVCGDDDFDFAAEDEAKAVTADGLFDTRETRAVSPFVELAPECVGLELDKTEFAGSDETVAAGSVDVGNGRVDDRGLGRTPDLGQIGQKSSEILRKG